MRPVVLDTNILLDIFVFNDERAHHLKKVLFDKTTHFVASQKTIEEFADVISRPLFKLDEQTQVAILAQWQSIVEQQDDSNLAPAPWTCQDPDDQIFLDLAYQLRPSILISKDNVVLQTASRAASEDILITSDYNAFRL
ncbi:putative toxin-antitoxin system toxin component, PIN family [Polynucleobacter sp. AP-Elch-400A-B2]|uniref:putative toxin-antitoxin system toxin component, PIN family n=1 Tax=Polynucleobacter sp. AP-Elch-400A-B2 TaxID=2576930 RepID=UPI001BFE1DE7|nr:putative toxin-antitoxin system toxin component, PIN family [Polynucleobacter sp. AP-Elch-400A-B2]QWE25320.1 putative toxin-antitoxin system toxin component, PIN family [Polynucleobacter sp. AP-Elch-400A-B2]